MKYLLFHMRGRKCILAYFSTLVKPTESCKTSVYMNGCIRDKNISFDLMTLGMFRKLGHNLFNRNRVYIL